VGFLGGLQSQYRALFHTEAPILKMGLFLFRVPLWVRGPNQMGALGPLDSLKFKFKFEKCGL